MDAETDGTSELGTHEYWETAYEAELSDLHSTGDEGEVWFGVETMETMLEWTCKFLQARCGAKWLELQVLDIGTGNGAMLVSLYQRGFRAITGSDYSRASLSLAAAVLQKNGCSSVNLVEDDMTDSRLTGPYGLLLDKGTYDAIGLSEQSSEAKKAYRRSAARLLSTGGLLVITSCNSTVEELRHDFLMSHSCSGEQASNFKSLDHVRTYPTFKFGG